MKKFQKELLIELRRMNSLLEEISAVGNEVQQDTHNIAAELEGTKSRAENK